MRVTALRSLPRLASVVRGPVRLGRPRQTCGREGPTSGDLGSGRGGSTEPRFKLYLGLLACLGVGRLLELSHSRRNERRIGPILGVAAARGFPMMVALHACLFALPPVEIAARRLPIRRAFSAPALVTLAGATALRVWSIRSLGQQWNVRGAVPAGGRTVATGPYRFVRHPNYLAVSLEMVAVPLAWPAPLSALALALWNGVVLLPRIRSEERLLANLPGYDETMIEKKRFIPGLF